MRSSGKKSVLKALSRQEGTVAVETVILLPVFVLIILAIMEFGHLWHVRQTLTIASREGARAGVVYPDPEDPSYIGDREDWANNQARDAVNKFLKNNTTWNEEKEDWTVIVQPSGNEPLTGKTLTVQVRTNNSLLILHNLITEIPVVAQTTMYFE
jgi:Flp pilus assembly protein TadG